MNAQTLRIIDTHSHLCDEAFRNDRAKVLVDARAIGIIGVIGVGEDLKDAELTLKLTEIHPEILPTAGLYPGIIDKAQAETVEAFIIDNYQQLVAIGEVGLDYWIAKTDEQRQTQREIFSRFIELSLELNLPLNVHSRSAGRQTIDLLLEKGATQVQLHAFDGKATHALKGVAAGYFFSVPPSIVRSQQKQNLIKRVPLTALLLETDSPVLGPEPGQRNVPANIVFAAESIAQIKGVPVERVYQAAFENTLALYGKAAALKRLRYDIG